MGLIRLIIIIALVYVAWRLVKATLAQGRRTGPSATPDKDRERMERMLPCARCGVHVPESEALLHDDKAFCSQQHQREYLEDHNR